MRIGLCWRRALLAGVFLGWLASAAQALPRFQTREFCPLQLGGPNVGMALLVEYYNQLPDLGPDDSRAARVARLKALETFKHNVALRYTEGTLQRLLACGSARGRRAAALALGLVGTMRSNKAMADALRDDDRHVRMLAADALWSLWFRASTDPHNKELERLIRLKDPEKALAGLDALLQKAPDFAEAYNQRAILLFRLGKYQKSIADCETVIKLNPYHFGAHSGMAQSFMKLRKPRAALRAFRNAFRINPDLEGVEATIRALEDALGEEGKNK